MGWPLIALAVQSAVTDVGHASGNASAFKGRARQTSASHPAAGLKSVCYHQRVSENHSAFLLLLLLPASQVTMPDDMSSPLIRGDGGAAAGGRGGDSRHLEASLSNPNDPLVGILGTGDFSRSLAQRLLAAGYQVVVGSRTPKRFVALFPEEVEV